MDSQRGEIRELRRESSGQTSDDDNEAADSDSHNRSCWLAEHGSDELEKVDAALKRLTDGSYGYCEMCGQQIPSERLEALPDTATCVVCQRLNEALLGTCRHLARGWVDGTAKRPSVSRLPHLRGGKTLKLAGPQSH